MEKRNSRRHRKQGRNIWNWEVKVKVEVEKIERVGQRERLFFTFMVPLIHQFLLFTYLHVLKTLRPHLTPSHLKLNPNSPISLIFIPFEINP